MRSTADVVVIGGGVMGASIAYHLAVQDVTNVVLLEATKLAAEGTGHSGALVRQHYSQDVITRIALRSVEIFEGFEGLTGRKGVFHQTGWIKLGSPQMKPSMEKLIVRHRKIGVEARMLSIDELKDAIPGINTDGIGAALIEPRGGYADPVATTQGFAEAARVRGVEILQQTSVTGVRVRKGKVIAVEAGQAVVQTDMVVDAAGPWGRRIASWVGVDVPITVTREQDVVLACDDQSLMPRFPVSNGVDRDYWRREEGKHLLVGDGHPKEIETADPDRFERRSDRSFEEMIMGRLRHRLPAFAAQARIESGYASLYDVTPDWHPVLGRVPEVDGFMLCLGFSGHGFKLGPAVGQLMAEEIVDGRAHTIDITPLNLRRFAEGKLLEGAYAGNQA